LIYCKSGFRGPTDNTKTYQIQIKVIPTHVLCSVFFFAGDVPRVNGQLAVSRAFGDKSLKTHLRSDPDVKDSSIDDHTDVLVLASDGLWKVMANQEAIDIARRIKDPLKAAKELTTEALRRDSKDDISCIVVRLR
jgi:serine/threonine protein phosphatase PrpC